eukprot:PRCOL_00000709-RA
MCGPDDFRDPAKVRTVYYPEVEALVKAATGCERVLVFDHTLREGRPAQARAGGDGAQSLNVLGDASKSAAAVRRVHCDYSAASAPARLRQIVEQLGRVEDGASGGGAALDSSERAAVLRGRYAFINVWRSVDADAPVQQDPLAMCDARSVRASEAIPYKMVFPERVGENLALQHGDHHKWFFYPQMTADEALVFKVYDSREAAEHDGTRFTYHTAFSDPTAPADARPRRSIEVRTVASFAHERPPHFFDMKHSNNAARVRLWLSKKGLPEGAVQTTMVKYDDLQTEEFGRINPLRKVPALLDAYGGPLIESAVILDYLEDKFAGQGAAESFTPGAAEERALVRLLIRIHDTYIASPNSTQPGFSHTQGAMYLAPYETPFCPPWRAMDRATRAAKLREIWKQLQWLEEQVRGPYLAGAALTLADFTWYPTAVFMYFMLPRVFDWPRVFEEREHFPKLAEWFGRLSQDEAFARVRDDIVEHFEAAERAGQFDSIKDETKDPGYKWRYP